MGIARAIVVEVAWLPKPTWVVQTQRKAPVSPTLPWGPKRNAVGEGLAINNRDGSCSPPRRYGRATSGQALNVGGYHELNPPEARNGTGCAPDGCIGARRSL